MGTKKRDQIKNKNKQVAQNKIKKYSYTDYGGGPVKLTKTFCATIVDLIVLEIRSQCIEI